MNRRFSLPFSGGKTFVRDLTPATPWTGEPAWLTGQADGDEPDWAPLFLSEPATAAHRPEGYEPNYAYPLVVWFHDAGQQESVLQVIAPQISDRNVVGLALRGEWMLSSGGYTWAVSGRAVDTRLQRVHDAVRELRGNCHLHTERVVLAGQGAGAAAAAELFLSRPNWFGGLAMFDPSAESLTLGSGAGATRAFGAAGTADVSNAGCVEAKPVLFGSGDPEVTRTWTERLTAAGYSPTFRADGAVTTSALRDLNRWLLAAVCGVT